MFLTIDYNERKQRKNVDVIHDMLPIRNNVIHCIDLVMNSSQMMCCSFAECQILVMSSTTRDQRRVDKISLTIDYNKRKLGRGSKMLSATCYQYEIVLSSVLILLSIPHNFFFFF